MNDLDFDLRAALHRDADVVGKPSPNLLEQLGQRRRHQRHQRVAMLSVVLGVVVLAAGIPVGQSLLARSSSASAVSRTVADETPSVDSGTVPPASTASPDPTVSPSDTPAVDPTTAAPETTAPSPKTSDALVLGPDGLGSLKLGMSRDQAEATGLVEPFWSYPESGQCLWRSALTGAPARAGTVFYSETFGVATIEAYPGVHTPEGIGIGSSLAAVEAAYPGFRPHSYGPAETPGTGRGYAWVSGNSQLQYRIVVVDSTVTELTLQYWHQDCYE